MITAAILLEAIKNAGLIMLADRDASAADRAIIKAFALVAEPDELPSMEFRLPELAGRLYTRYCATVGGKALNGDPLPTWEAFSVDATKSLQYNAWIATASEAIALLCR